MKLLLAVAIIAALTGSAFAVCPNSCNGHGTCNEFDQCDCFDEGKTVYFGASADQTTTDTSDTSSQVRTGNYGKMANVMKQWTGADCSLMTCPRGMSWDTPNTKTTGCSTHEDFAECSDKGLCDRTTGQCNCFDGYTGPACQRSTCVNNCNGHGVCQSNLKFARDAGAHYTGAWDSGNHYGCKCDLGYRGPDCSMRECPSGSDPLKFKGNSQGRDCSGRGLCDYSSGQCNCFDGYTGFDCSMVNALS